MWTVLESAGPNKQDLICSSDSKIKLSLLEYYFLDVNLIGRQQVTFYDLISCPVHLREALWSRSQLRFFSVC